MLKKILSLGCFLFMIASIYPQKTISAVDPKFKQAATNRAAAGNNLINQQARILLPPPNSAPTNISISNSALDENVVSNSTVGTLSSTDANIGNTFTYTLVAGAGNTDNAAFSISGSSLQINSSPDFETKSSYSIRVRTTDQGSLTFEKSFTITINDLVEVLLSTNPTLNFTSNSVAITGDGIASDGDGGSLTITDINIQIYNISDTSGTLLNQLSWQSNTFLGSANSAYSGLTSPLNDGSKGMAIKSADGSEFSFKQFKYYNWGATESLTNTVIGYRNGVEVASTTFEGYIAGYEPFIVTFDSAFENVDEVRFYISAGGFADNQAYTNHSINNIQVGPPTLPNNAPTDIVLTSTSIDENATANSTVGTVSSTDADSGNTFAYALVAGAGDTDNAAFTISSSSLQINSSPDFETKSSYSIRVQTTDQGSLTFEKSFTITINDLNEAPTNVALSASTLNENVTASTTIGNWITTDLDLTNTYTYTLVAGDGSTDNDAFSIVDSSLKNNYTPDFETKSSYFIRVRTTDQGGLYYEKSFTITINDLDETPPVVAPILSYTTASNVFSFNTAITPLDVTNTGGAITSIPGSVSTVSQINNITPFITIDALGNQYFSKDNEIMKLTSAGELSTLAGGETSGFLNGTGTSAQFNNPIFLAVDATGNVYVGDIGNYAIRKITSSGVVTTLAGGTEGTLDGTGAAAQFGNILGLAVDATGNVYAVDADYNSIRKITPEGIVTTFAGGTYGLDDGVGTAAQFQTPYSIAIDPSGTLFVTEVGPKPRIRKITSAGVVTTFAGGTPGQADGVGTSAQFYMPLGIAIDPSGTLYVTEFYLNSIRKITAAGVVTTLVATGVSGFQDGPLATAQFGNPLGIALNPSGDLIVIDAISSTIRKIILPVVGYTISPALPAGLVLDPATGSVSGTPTVASLATDYTVSASNAGGSGTFKLNIAISLPAPTASAQTFCGSKTVADLVATGTNLKWYDVATNGTALEITTAIATGTYYVSQTNNSIESARTAVDITVSTTAAPTASSQTFCGSKTVADLVASGNDLKWYDVATNGTVLNTSTALSLGNYYVSQTINSCESARTLVTVSSNNAVAGTVSEGQLIVRGTKPAPISISLIESFGTVQWQTSLNNIKFTNIVGATGSTLTSDQMGILTRRRFYRAVLTSTCNTATSEVVQVWTTLETKIQDSQCGQTLASLTTNVSAIAVPGADLYRFKVVQGATTRTIVTRTKGFSLKSLEDGFLFNTTYTISVATQSIGLWSAYGPECSVTTPSGLTKIKDSQCGTTLANINNKIVANAVAGVTNYRFKVDHGGTTRTIETVAAAFSLKSLVGGTLSGTAYTISVATKYNGVWGEYGQACEVTTPGAALPSVSRQAATAIVQEIVSEAVSVVTYPNPFDATFKLDFQSSSDANILVSVYDMNGRLLENKEVKSSEINNLELGNGYPSGVYNAIITQENEVKTIRVIKK